METNKILKGDVFERLKDIPNDSVDCIVTSPPYYGLRSYKTDSEKEIGKEDHPQKYIDKIVDIVDECMRVLKPTGVMWLNLGDSYATPSGKGSYDRWNKERNKTNEHRINSRSKFSDTENWLKKKQKLLIPHRVAIGIQDRGHIVRDDTVWVKKMIKYPELESIGSTMPFPVQDRFLPATEYVFQIVKSPKYYFNLEPVKTKLKQESVSRAGRKMGRQYTENDSPYSNHTGMSNYYENISTENLSVGKGYKNWNLNIEEPKKANPTNAIMFKKVNGYKTKEVRHYAKFPEYLAEFFIKCSCPEGGLVFDPMSGSGTTLAKAKELGLNYLGIEISDTYVEDINHRLFQDGK